MTDDDPLVHELAEALVAAQHRRRTRRSWGAITTPAVPNWAIDAFCEATVPIWRRIALDAARQALAERAVTVEDRSPDTPAGTARAARLAARLHRP